MSRIVDVEPLDCLAWKDGEHGTTFDDGVLWVLEKIGELPTIEPQSEIIRCKDCKHADDDGVCKNSVGLVIQDDDDFCSKAERRTDEQTDRY